MTLFLVCLTLYICTHILGHTIQSFAGIPKNKDFLVDAFTSTMIGLLGIIVIYSLVLASGKSIFILIPIIGLLTLFRLKSERQKPYFKANLSIDEIKGLGIGITLFLVFYFIQSFLFYNKPFNNVPHGDITAYYTKVIDYLNYYGVESRNKALFGIIQNEDTPTPYHYGEFWISALLSKFSNALSVESFTVATHAYLSAILGLGLISLSRTINKNVIHQLLSLLFMFASGITVFQFLPQSESFKYALGWNPKFIIVALFFIWFVIMVFNKKKFYYFPLLMLPIINIGLAPAIFSGLVIFALASKVLSKPIDIWKSLIVDSFFVAIGIVSFYLLLSGSGSSGDFEPSSIMAGWSNDWTKAFKIGIGAIFIVIALYIFYTLPFVFLVKKEIRSEYRNESKNHRVITTLFILFFTIGLATWAITHAIHDSMQFFYLPGIILLNIIILLKTNVLLSIVQRHSVKSYSISLFLVIGLIVYNLVTLRETPFYRFNPLTKTYSSQFLKELKSSVDKELKKSTSPVFYGYLAAPEDIIGYWNSLSTANVEAPLRMLTSGIYGVNLNGFHTPIKNLSFSEKRTVKKNIEHSALYNFGIKMNYPNQISNEDELIFQFVIQNKIQFLLLSPHAKLPKKFEKFVAKKIHDQTSKRTFVVLKK